MPTITILFVCAPKCFQLYSTRTKGLENAFGWCGGCALTPLKILHWLWHLLFKLSQALMITGGILKFIAHCDGASSSFLSPECVRIENYICFSVSKINQTHVRHRRWSESVSAMMLLYIFFLWAWLIVLWTHCGKKAYVKVIYIHVRHTRHRLNWLLTLLFKCHIPLQSPWQSQSCYFFTHEKKERGRVCDCLLSFFICLCKQPRVGGISLFLGSGSKKKIRFHAKISWNS